MASPVKRETMRACLSCRLCDSILRDATTISECLHTFCRKCIYEKIREDEIECCPVCNIDLGGAPLEKLRPDHNFQDLRAKIFPLKRRKANAPEIVSLSARRKERSISSLIVSTPRVSEQAGTTGKRAKTATRKVLGGNGSLAERTVKKEESSFREELMGHEPEDILAFSKECSFKTMVNLATLGERYERQVLEQERVNEHPKMRNQVGEEVLSAVIRETRQALEDEKARSAALESSLEQVRARAMETDQAFAELEAEKARSAALEEELALARGEVAKACGEREASRSRVTWLEGAIERAKVVVAKESDRVKKKWAARNQKWATKMEKIRGHLAGRDQALPTHLLLSQVVGTRQCLERMEAEDNLVVPFYRYAKLKEDAVKYEAELDHIDFPELTSEDLEVPADRTLEVQLQQPPSNQTQAASSPPRVASDPSAMDSALGATAPLGQADIAALPVETGIVEEPLESN